MKTYMYIDDDVFKSDGYRKPQQYYQKYFPQYLPLFEHYRDFQKVIMVNSGITAIQLMEQYGCPDVISFDNDLGQQIEGYHIAKWIVNKDIDTNQKFIPQGFTYVIHSQNPIAAKRIKSLLDQYLEVR